MKSIFSILFIVAMMSYTAVAQGAGGISKGSKYVNYKFPDGITTSKTVLFPTSSATTATFVSDSVNVNVKEVYNYVELPAQAATRRVKLSNQTYLSGGEQLVIQGASTNTTPRNLIIQYSGGGPDTLQVTNRTNRIQYYFTGTKWVPVSKY